MCFYFRLCVCFTTLPTVASNFFLNMLALFVHAFFKVFLIVLDESCFVCLMFTFGETLF